MEFSIFRTVHKITHKRTKGILLFAGEVTPIFFSLLLTVVQHRMALYKFLYLSPMLIGNSSGSIIDELELLPFSSCVIFLLF